MREETGRLPRLPQGWVSTTLGESAHVVLGQSPPSSTYNADGIGLPFYQGKAEFGDTYPTPQKWCTTPKKIAEKGDVLISVRAPVGPTNICPERSCIGRGLAAIRGLGGIPPLFVMHLLRSLEDDIAEKGTGTTFNAITGSQLKQIPVPLPPLAEQQRIVGKIEELFSQLDAGVTALQKAKAQLQHYRQAVLKAAMSGELTREWREAHKDELEPASVLLQRILQERRPRWEAEQVQKMKAKGKAPRDHKWKQRYVDPVAPAESALPNLPEGWRWASFGQIVSLCQNGFGRRRSDKGTPTVVLRLSDLVEGRIVYDNVRRIGACASEVENHKLEANDILCIRVNGSPDLVGRMTRFDPAPEPIMFCDHFIRFRLADPGMAGFVSAYFETNIPREHVASNMVCTAGQNTVSQVTMRDTPVPVPPIPEMQRIAEGIQERLFLAELLGDAIEQNLRRSKLLRESILKKAFEGALVPQDPTDEPASVLLERIKAEKARREAETKQITKKRQKKEPDQPTLFT